MENELSFSTRRRVFLIQIIYALVSNYENLLTKDDKSILAVANSAAMASRYKAKIVKEANLDIHILLETVHKLSIIDDLILQNCNSGSLERLSKVVLSILRVGVYELKYAPHQYSVANIMRDYLNIAVAFEHDPESGFINSILDKVYSQR